MGHNLTSLPPNTPGTISRIYCHPFWPSKLTTSPAPCSHSQMATFTGKHQDHQNHQNLLHGESPLAWPGLCYYLPALNHLWKCVLRHYSSSKYTLWDFRVKTEAKTLLFGMSPNARWRLAHWESIFVNEDFTLDFSDNKTNNPRARLIRNLYLTT